MSHREALPYRSVEWLWEELTKVYGHRFLSLWDGLDTGAIKEDWRQRLAGLTPRQLQFGLDNLPGGRPPDAIALREICARCTPAADAPALPQPRKRRPVPAHMRAVVDHLLSPKRRGDEPMKVTIARRFVRSFEHQENLTPRQREDLAHYRAILERWQGDASGGEAPQQQEASDVDS